MSETNGEYRRICDQIWALYQAQIEKEKPRRSKRKVQLPPPHRGRPADLLIVGNSPRQVGPVGYASDRAGAERLAREFEYINAGGKKEFETAQSPLLWSTARVCAED